MFQTVTCTMAYTTQSPLSFPLSSSRGTRQLPSLPTSLCTTLPPLPSTSHFAPRQQPEPMYHSFGPTDSYFPSTLSPTSPTSSTSSTPSPSSEPRKRTSIPSLLASPALSGSSGNETSPASSPNYHWSNNLPSSSTSRSGSVETSPVQLPSFNTNDFDSVRYDEKLFTTNNNVNRKKART